MYDYDLCSFFRCQKYIEKSNLSPERKQNYEGYVYGNLIKCKHETDIQEIDY